MCGGTPPPPRNPGRWIWVYPRVCGGTPSSKLGPSRTKGLSPRVRGNPQLKARPVQNEGSIPACAGEPAGASAALPTGMVYPRVCGGTSATPNSFATSHGLSPRVRGNPAGSRSSVPRSGSIPACAGEPEGGFLPNKKGVVYPRVCGGTRYSHACRPRCRGLSPRVRGNLRGEGNENGRPGSIPACAGEPWYQGNPGSGGDGKGLSPRVRGNRKGGGQRPGSRRSIPACAGEPPGATRTACVTAGLSPRVRGNRLWPRRERRGPGSIPACAGEPRPVARAYARDPVYPRVCGGTQLVCHNPRPQDGLSPRVRGNPSPPARSRGNDRSIPACAGEPLARTRTCTFVAVYPRVCGGTGAGLEQGMSGGGLSPRVRGNPSARLLSDGPNRSIPACAGEPSARAAARRPRSVYPRVCGGTLLDPDVLRVGDGLSPRVRGNPCQGGQSDAADRSIPACAGEPEFAGRRQPGQQVYPRVCGGTILARNAFTLADGLSPRVRGNRPNRYSQPERPGSIPACAGEPHRATDKRAAVRVYPRVCGGTPFQLLPGIIRHGLSPRVRGNLLPCRRGHRKNGSIPACAGEPRPSAQSAPERAVYPRVCGGTAMRCNPLLPCRGLSPRVRGNQPRILYTEHSRRSIPACAGEPAWGSAHPGTSRVYPRVCGGTPPPPAATLPTCGLSPRVRGNLVNVRLVGICGRSIPACAGEPRRFCEIAVKCAVYPRVCGGTLTIARLRSDILGLSPRVRGNLRFRLRQPVNARSIPACAGEPVTRLPGNAAMPVYPRVCGGTAAKAAGNAAIAGLSPRVRGNPGPSARRIPIPRSIPACAGEPATGNPARAIRRVYPRVCGGTAVPAGYQLKGQGLSPRVRGNPRRNCPPDSPRRSIPACAGEPRRQ